MKKKHFLPIFITIIILFSSQVPRAQQLPIVNNVDLQPFKAQIERLIQARDFLGEPFTVETKRKISQALKLENESEAISIAQQILDAQCLIDVQNYLRFHDN